MRFTKEDKKKIARMHDQYAYDYDLLGEPHFIGYRCRRCNGVFTRLSDFEVDHIKPRSQHGTDNPSNLQLLCRACNRKKSNKPWRKTGTAKTKRRTVRKKPSAVKKKASTVKRKTNTVKRRTSTTKRKPRTTRTKSSTAKRTRR